MSRAPAEPLPVGTHPALSRLAAFAPLTEAEIAILRQSAGPVRRLRRGEVLGGEGDEHVGCYVLIDGWTASTVAFPSGRRQMIKVHLPGDMLGSPALALQESPETITALTPVTAVAISAEGLGRLFKEAPRVAALLYLVAQEERVLLMDRLAALGRSSAKERLASLLLQMNERMVLGGKVAEASFELPLSRVDVADLAGITTVHLNRIVRELTAQGMISWHGRVVQLVDLDALKRLSGLPARLLTSRLGWIHNLGL